VGFAPFGNFPTMGKFFDFTHHFHLYFYV
jgi:hypothetical protein